MKTRILLRWCALFAIWPCAIHGQELPPVATVGARNTSLANANISEYADVSVMYQNPAPLAFLETRSLVLDHAQGTTLQGMREDLAALVLPPAPVALAVGMNMVHQGAGIRNQPAGQQIFQYGFDIALAARVTPTLGFGGSASGTWAWTHSPSRAEGVHYSLGAAYAPTPDVSYGLVFTGLGDDVSYSLDGSGMVARGARMRNTLAVGATMCYPRPSSLRPPILLLSLANEKTFGNSGLIYRGGLALRPVEFLELRFGYAAGPDMHSATYGIGLLVHAVSLQYGLVPQEGTGIWFQQISACVEM